MSGVSLLNNNAFKTYHPLVNFVYFGSVFMFTMFFMHPIALGITFISSLFLAISLKGFRALKVQLIFLIPLIIFTALLNPLFNHEGVTILMYFKTGNPLTLESIVYGFASSLMLMSMVIWFYSFNAIISSDKFVYLFGKIMPSLSLVLSMSLRFVPKFIDQIKIVTQTQKTLGKDVSSGNVFKRMQHGLLILSITISWALEDGIETADSMKSRGYGLENRTSFSIYTLSKYDKTALGFMSVLSTLILIAGLNGFLAYDYFPSLTSISFGVLSGSIWILYALLCLTPILINKKEERLWKYSISNT